MKVIFFEQVKKLMESFIEYEIEDEAVQLMTNFLNGAVNEICDEFIDVEEDVITEETVKRICKKLYGN